MIRAMSIVGLLVALTGPPLHGQADAVFAGFLNAWGVAVPGAVYSGGSWQRVTDADDFAERYWALNRTLSMESRDLWSVLLDSGEVQTIEAGTVVLFHDTYFLAWGLLTNVPAATIRPTNRRPYAVGPLVSAPHHLTAVEELVATDGHYSDVLAALQGSIPDWDAAPGFEIRDAYWISDSSSPGGWAYFLAERWTDGDPRDPNCRAVEVISGWVRAPAGAAEWHLEPRVTSDCDRKGDEFLHPLAVVELDERLFVVAQLNGWESNVVEVVELSLTGPVRWLR